jgi:predicted cupin superfamily sugar epimerase
MARSEVDQLIERLNLKKHPQEGGYFVETYRSKENIETSIASSGSAVSRSLSTAIYFLLTSSTFSEMHRLPFDEVYHFYCGDAVEMLLLYPDGNGRVVRLGGDIMSGEEPQVIIPSGVWQGSGLSSGGRFGLLGTTMAPGFDLQDYQSGEREFLSNQYPGHIDRIRELTRR